MPLRGLLYFARIYDNYVEQHKLDVYSSVLQRLPVPRYLIFYNGRNDAVHAAVEESICLGVLKDILTKSRNEVVDMILTTFDQELHDKTEREAAYAEGRAAGETEGKALGKAEVVSMIRRKIGKGMIPGDVADVLELNKDYVEKIVTLIEEDVSRTDLQVAEMLLR